MFTYSQIPMLGVFAVIIIALIGIGIWIKGIRDDNIEQIEFEKRLKAAQRETTAEAERRITEGGKLNLTVFWGDLLSDSGIFDKGESYTKIARLANMFCALIYLLSFILSRNPFVGFIPIGFGIYIIKWKANKEISDLNTQMEDQIPSFVATLKANVQANETPENALMNAINSTADPLYSELKIARALIETGSFKSALLQLRLNTKNKNIKFLCSCIELASDTGANLEEQIVTIEEMMESQRELDRRLTKAVAENKPLVYVSSAIIPTMFLFMYFTQDSAKLFWFNEPISWIIFLIIIVLWWGGYFVANKIISKVSDFK